MQKVVMRLSCTVCAGSGRISKAPKGTRKAKIKGLPGWRLSWSNCTVCQGDGYVDSTEIELAPAKGPTVEYASSETAYGRTVAYGFALKVF